MKRTGFKRKNKPLYNKNEYRKKRSGLRALGKSTTSQIKREIQALLRQIVIKRDGGCILRGRGACSEVLQAEHLITRANSATYADTRNVVCLCVYHHIFFKKQYSQIYWELIEQKIGPERWAWYKMMRDDRTPQKVDWVLAKLALEQELKNTIPYALSLAK